MARRPVTRRLPLVAHARRAACRPAIVAALALLAQLALLTLGARAGHAQLVPHADWRTIATPHFRVHFTRDVEALARRAAVSAERAHARLARDLAPPRGTIDLVVADNVDYSNGFATTFPTNRIVVYATPPVDGGTLRHYHDWIDLVVTHELVHLFHLDRTRGPWRVGQWVFGRNPALFPNQYSPSWLIEGIAVWYESRLTGSGRLAGTPHRVQAQAAAAGGVTPRLDQLSSATPVFPGGSAAYVWGSLAVERVAEASGGAGMRRFIDGTAGTLVPFRLDRAARRAFGERLTDAWREWSDSVARAATALARDSAWRTVGDAAWDARAPRWLPGGREVAWPASFPREVGALWLADSAGRMRRVSRRNSLDVNAPRPGGGFVFSQLELVDAFHVRADLWVEHGGRRRRLTRGARLLQPDVRDDGRIVAVQVERGTTRLVSLREDDPRIVPITVAHPDTQWSEPRWGRDAATLLVAARRIRGGRSEIVRLDTAGGAHVLLASDAVEASPAWDGDGCVLWSVSDRRGLPVPVTLAGACAGAASARTTASPPRGTAGVLALDPNPRRDDAFPDAAALGLGARGYRLLLHDAAGAAPADSVVALADSAGTARARLADTTGQDAAHGAARRYSPWRTLRPTWWLPLVGESGEGTTMLGAYSSGGDVVGRHAWSAEAMVPVAHAEEWEGALAWRWRGLGQPAIDVGLEQEWLRVRVPDVAGREGGRIVRRDRTMTLGASLIRPRVYSSASVSVGVEAELRTAARADPDSLLDRFTPLARQSVTLPGAYVSAAWSALQRAPLAVSLEDGVALAATVRQRWQEELGIGDGRTAIAVARAYRSLPLPGYARHVVAARVAAAWANDESTSDFSAGGTSGSSIELFPGVIVGDASRAFGARGFAAGTLRGNRAASGALEYRAPLFLANRGYRLLPLFLSRTGLTLFGESASAWCDVAGSVPVCAGPTSRRWLASVGGELFADASATYDLPYRLRLGVAVPVAARELARGAGPSAYVTFGAAF